MPAPFALEVRGYPACPLLSFPRRRGTAEDIKLRWPAFLLKLIFA